MRISVAGSLLVSLYVVYRLTLGWLVENRIEAIRRTGYPATLTELNSWYQQTPAGQNAADIYVQAFAQFAPVCGDEERSLPLVGTGPFPSRDSPMSDATRQTIVELLDGNIDAIQILRQAAQIRPCRYPLNLADGIPMTSFGHLRQVRRAAHLLQLKALLDARDGRPDAASEALVASLACARSLANEPMFASHLARLECDNSGVETLQSLLDTTTLTADQLRELATAFAEAEDGQGIVRAFVGRRCWASDSFQRVYAVTDVFTAPSGYQRSAFGALIFANASLLESRPFQYKASGLLEIDQLRYLRIMDKYVKTAQVPMPERLEIARAIHAQVKALPSYSAIARSWLLVLDGPRVMTIDARTLARLRSASVALAIERYRTANGKLPEQLADLSPSLLKTVPSDPFDGQPLRYRQTTEDYLVYSVGDDGHDDGGDVSKDLTFAIAR